ncbi:uncharacterized protein TRIADDRAFT_62152 [Trichoplax adhaerens]|uniref:ENTH domain-containing protein n=1 Tax=Trichoplax adhaerens TaxID=10228 RepID=B3SCZ5_TRIAD|nr:predicted protein [Trichoplax adhaerens]EDV19429.1 predicted protein [Trichoplax adhaerens]|eukprot:XP_002118118.1 predicted protein [Trichoplax adhaerens]
MSSSITFTNLFDKISFTSKMPTLMKATSDDATATPEMSFESSNTCKYLLDFLMDRLMKSSYHIKLKVLRLIRHLLVNGNGEFLTNLRKRSDIIRKTTTFSGSPDPLHGNAPYEQVRQLANENIRILFDVSDKEKHLKAKQVGDDSSKPSPQSSFAINSKPDKLEEEQPLPVRNFHSETVADRVTGRPGGGWDDHATKIDLIKKGDTARQFMNPQSTTLPKPLPARTKNLENANVSLCGDINSQTGDAINYEKALVDDITVPVGVRSAPTTAMLDSFMKRCNYLDHHRILLLLCEKLKEPVGIQQKALCVIERALKKSDFWSLGDIQLLSNQIELLSTSSNVGLRSRVSKVEALIQESQRKPNIAERIQSVSTLENQDEANLISTTDESLQVKVTETSDAISKGTSDGLFIGMFLSKPSSDINDINSKTTSEPLIDFGSIQQTSSNDSVECNSEASTKALDDLFTKDTVNPTKTTTSQAEASMESLINFSPVAGTSSKAIENSTVVKNSTESLEFISTNDTISSHSETANRNSDGNSEVAFHKSLLKSSDLDSLTLDPLSSKRTTISTPYTSAKDAKRGFDFLNKSSKGNAFNFVSETMQAEMKGRKL